MFWQESPRWGRRLFPPHCKASGARIDKKVADSLRPARRTGRGGPNRLGPRRRQGTRKPLPKRLSQRFRLGGSTCFCGASSDSFGKNTPLARATFRFRRRKSSLVRAVNSGGDQARPGIAGYFAMEMGLAHLCKCGKLPAQGGFIHKNGFHRNKRETPRRHGPTAPGGFFGRLGEKFR